VNFAYLHTFRDKNNRPHAAWARSQDEALDLIRRITPGLGSLAYAGIVAIQHREKGVDTPPNTLRERSQ
jgi:hypothetical protein